jgi:hypothetical protein
LRSAKGMATVRTAGGGGWCCCMATARHRTRLGARARARPRADGGVQADRVPTALSIYLIYLPRAGRCLRLVGGGRPRWWFRRWRPWRRLGGGGGVRNFGPICIRSHSGGTLAQPRNVTARHPRRLCRVRRVRRLHYRPLPNRLLPACASINIQYPYDVQFEVSNLG